MFKKTLILSALCGIFALQKIAIAAQRAAPGKLVDIGGYNLHVYATGHGAPNVILDACLGGNCMYWSLVQPEVEKIVQVCSYDRGGLGWSDASPHARDSQHIVEELHTLLQNSGISAPYILVGHSSGGINMRLFANTYPDEVYGVILVDASHEDQLETFEKIDAQFHTQHSEVSDSLFPAAQKELLESLESTSKAQKADHDEWVCFKASMAQLKSSTNHLLDKPLTVITAGKKREDRAPDWDKARMRAYDEVWRTFQTGFLNLSHLSTQLFAEKSRHFVVFEQPEIIVEAIRSMVNRYLAEVLPSKK